jgi:hypothetical protein
MSVHAQIGTSSCERWIWASSFSSRSETQLIGSLGFSQCAAHAEMRNRCAGSVHESAGANM